MTKAQAVPVVHIDDDRFKVTEWQFAPGAETGWHVHGHDYVIVPLTDGTLGLDLPSGATATAALAQGVPYSRREGVHHNVTNAGSAPLSFLEVETVADHLSHQRREVLVRFMAAWNARDVDALMAVSCLCGAGGRGAALYRARGGACVLCRDVRDLPSGRLDGGQPPCGRRYRPVEMALCRDG